MESWPGYSGYGYMPSAAAAAAAAAAAVSCLQPYHYSATAAASDGHGMINLAATYFPAAPPPTPSHHPASAGPGCHQHLQPAAAHHVPPPAPPAAAGYQLQGHYHAAACPPPPGVPASLHYYQCNNGELAQRERLATSTPPTPSAPLQPHPPPQLHGYQHQLQHPMPSTPPVILNNHFNHHALPNYYTNSEPLSANGHLSNNSTLYDVKQEGSSGPEHPDQGKLPLQASPPQQPQVLYSSLNSTYSVEALVSQASSSTSTLNWTASGRSNEIEIPQYQTNGINNAHHPPSPDDLNSDGSVCSQLSSAALKCNVCNKNCDSYHALKRHRREHLQRSGNEGVALCMQQPPGAELSEQNALDANLPPSVQQVHSNPYQFVDDGGEDVQKKPARKKQKRSGAGSAALDEGADNVKPFFCELCGDRFTIKSSLVTHMRRHTGERPYQCSYCNKTFTQKGNLQTHIRTHTGEKPYRCGQCDKCYTSGAALNYHRNHHH